MRFHDPRGEVATPVDPYELHVDLAATSQPTIGLLANGFPDSDNFLEHVGAALSELLPGAKVLAWNKGNASIAAPEDMLQEIKTQCHAAIAAYGH